jgi:ABC-type sugar transport system ATPase subunit
MSERPAVDRGSAAPLLEVREIEKGFPGVRALSGTSFDVRAGKLHASLGENGAGKSLPSRKRERPR